MTKAEHYFPADILRAVFPELRQSVAARKAPAIRRERRGRCVVLYGAWPATAQQSRQRRG
jgi:hypothetical protein